MKFIHTGDWHIGKLVNQLYMTEDQTYLLEQFIALVASERPDAVIISGDLYDRGVPPVEAVELLDRVLSHILLDLQVPVMAIAGNHDSPDRVGFGSHILRAKGLHIEGRLQKNIRRVVLADEHGPVNFYLVPYAPPALVRETLGRNDIASHDDAMAAIVDTIKQDWNEQERCVLVAHGFVRGSEDPEVCDSEKPLSIGGTDWVSVKHCLPFTYTALGHLHGAQQVGSHRVRYAGSLMKYSFSEARQKKSVTVVRIDGDGQVSVELKSLSPRRDMRKIRGELQALLTPEAYHGTPVEDYLQVTLTDEGEVLDPVSKLRAVYPNVLELVRENKARKTGEAKTAAGEGYKQKSHLDLFGNFYENMTGQPFTAEKAAIVTKVIEACQREEGESL